MELAKNKSEANMLEIIYNSGNDLYIMRFYKCTFSKFNKKTFTQIELFEDIYSDMLQKIFTDVTGLHTKL